MKVLKDRIVKGRMLEWLTLSMVLLLLTTKSSPFFLTNDWVDSNAFFTVGKSMMQGLVPYRDLFDQKGPFLYLIYGVGSIINSKGFIGVFIIQCLAMMINLFYCFKILKLYLSESMSIVLTILFPVFILNEYYYRQGGSPEEFCIPLLMILIFQILDGFKKERQFLKFSKGVYFWQGLTVSAIFLIKFSLLGPWIAFYLFLFGYYLVKKEYRELIPFFIYSASGFLLGILPWLVYFVINDALVDFFNVYIVVNSGVYNDSSGNIVERIAYVIGAASERIKASFFGLFVIFPTLMFIPVWKKLSKPISHRLFMMIIILSTVFFIYMGLRSYEYYFLFMMPFGLFSLILIGQIVSKYKNSLSEVFEFKLNVNITWILFVSILVVLGSNSTIRESLFFPNNDTVSTNEMEQKVTAQELFAQYMHSKTPNPTLLNYEFLDGGFYLAADILPSEKYFILLNLDHRVYPDNAAGQIRAIQRKSVDFVVIETQTNYDEKNFKGTELGKNYQVAMSHDQSRDKVNHTYWLFEKKLSE
ncbi:hypothetical protein ACWOC1_03235 [Enterococcus quebecensis]|uniref:Glycosyltransferase RgtA/B/C/D-like domain-containing protein n=1 Tax=Enterococcus quebecensis TaxID=903983 RepID=A0A1E5GRL7_9ENTE|nr:hypothetical protein [Enterococcus quebecensis]OEG15205.1 hypothetical protein BCR23_10235 [Enterococcus quebecensis]OJG74784.1 hypothetical protein RV12_GL002201 [Enterococcus quebecensis]